PRGRCDPPLLDLRSRPPDRPRRSAPEAWWAASAPRRGPPRGRASEPVNRTWEAPRIAVFRSANRRGVRPTGPEPNSPTPGFRGPVAVPAGEGRADRRRPGGADRAGRQRVRVRPSAGGEEALPISLPRLPGGRAPCLKEYQERLRRVDGLNAK